MLTARTRRSDVARVHRRPLVLTSLIACTTVAFIAPPVRGQGVDPSYFGAMRWRLIGPYRSGNVYAVSGIPGNPDVYYVGTPEAGVWKSTDAGTVWTPIFDDEHIPSIGAVAVAPSDPNVVYVGTGDPTGWSFTPGAGVYKSTDAGKSWHKIGLDSTRYITSIVVDPHRPDVVLVAALGAREYGDGANSARGVYRTITGGRTWSRVLYKDPHTGATGLTFDYADPLVVYATLGRDFYGLSAAARDSLGPLGTGIYKSSDEGATWRPVSSTGLPHDATGFAVAVASGTHGQRVYAEALARGRDAQALYRTDDGGRSWRLTTKQVLSAGGGPIYVDPKNPDVVYLMGTALYRSVDGGRTVVAYKGAPGGDDMRDLWIDPTNPRRMLLGVDQGPTITVDGGQTWTPWYNLPNGQFYHVSTDNHFPYRVCAAQQDSGTACVLSRSDFGAIRDNDWYPVGGFEDGYIVADPLDERWVYTQGWYHVLRRYDRETGQVAVLYSPSADDRFGAAPPLAFSPQDPHTLYMGAQYVLASSDGARDWRRISPDLTAVQSSAQSTSRAGSSSPSPSRFRVAGTIETLAPSPVSTGEIWAGTSNGVIQLTRDGGANWTNVTPADLPEDAFPAQIHIIDASHDSAGTAYAAAEGLWDMHPYIYRTRDFGAHWQTIVTGLPDDAAVRVVREDPVDPNLLYAGTLMGVWVSFDQGDHWQPLQLNLPNTVVTDIDVHGADVAISTYGRALWILDDVTPLRELHAVSTSPAPAYLFRPETAYRVRWDNIEDTPMPPEVPVGANPPEGAILDYYLKTATSSPITLSIYDADDQLVRQYSSSPPAPDTSKPNIAAYWFEPPAVLPTTAGTHRIAWDLRFPVPSVLNYSYFGNLLDYTEYTLNTHAIKGHTPRVQPTGPLVVPGTYRIQLTVDGQNYSQQLQVVDDPRVPVSQAGLVAQLQLERRMMAGLSVSYAQFNQIQRLRAALAADTVGAPGSGRPTSLTDAARALDARVAALANATDSGIGTANRDLTRHLEDMESGDIDPTPSDVAVTDASCHALDAALADLRQVESTSVPDLNGTLAEAHLPPLPEDTLPAAPACAVTNTGAGSRVPGSG
jgi:photosystem II stability/assembly factor-like uncharacterized protein